MNFQNIDLRFYYKRNLLFVNQPIVTPYVILLKVAKICICKIDWHLMIIHYYLRGFIQLITLDTPCKKINKVIENS